MHPKSKMMKKLTILFVSCLITFQLFSQDDELQKGLDAITLQAVQGQLEFLASDWTEGRETAHKGEFIAGDYIASIFSTYGLQPGGDFAYTEVSRADRYAGIRPQKYRTFFQDIYIVKSKRGDNQELQVISNISNGKESLAFNYRTDYSIRGYSDVNIDFTAPLVFVGYGYTNEDEGYDDFKGVDVKGKIIVRLSGYPGVDDQESEAYKKFAPEGRYAWYYLRRDKNRTARENGAIAVIEIREGMEEYWAENDQFRFSRDYYEGDKELGSGYDWDYSLLEDTLETEMISVSATNRLFNYILENSGINLDEYAEYTREKMKPKSRDIKGKSIRIKSSVETEIVKARNVIGVIEGQQPDSIIVIGGHYDHLGMYDGYIWNGADDNASGTVGVMTIAKAVLATGVKPVKTLVFAAWTGEEKGFLGSRYFVEHPYKPVENIIANINLDMIARSTEKDTLENKLSIGYYTPYPSLKEMSERNNEDYEIDLDLNFWESEGGGGSDHAAFSRKKIPFAFFITGIHGDYHTPKDELHKIDYEKMVRVIKLGFICTWEMANTTLKP